MAIAVEIDGLRPGKVRNKTTVAKKFAVVVDWDPPIAWEDGSTADFDLSSAVSHYEVDLLSGGSVIAQDLHVVRTKVRFDRDAGSGPYSSRVRAIGHDMEYTTEDGASGSAVPEGVGFGELSGSVSKSQMGSLGISRYGSTTAMNAASAVNGDIWINTSYTPRRVFRYEAGVWNHQVDGAVLVAGTVIADAVVAGALDAYTINGVIINAGTITGAKIQTATSGTRVVLSDTINGNDRINLYDNNGWAGSIRGAFGRVVVEGGLRMDSGLEVSENAYTPSSGHFVIFKTPGSNGARIRWPNGMTSIITTGAEF